MQGRACPRHWVARVFLLDFEVDQNRPIVFPCCLPRWHNLPSRCHLHGADAVGASASLTKFGLSNGVDW